jgi:polyphosphate kinase
MIGDYSFYNRDLSWLSFNERVMMEAASPQVPLMERLKFLSIFSSNLDEFYRVRIPAIQSIYSLNKKIKHESNLLPAIATKINEQQEKFGQLLEGNILPHLKESGIYIVYNEPIPEIVISDAVNYFFNTIASFIKITYIDKADEYFPANNKLYIAVSLREFDKGSIALVNIPSDDIGRFFITKKNETYYVVFIDDIIELCLNAIFSQKSIAGVYRIKVTRDAELELMDEFEGEISEKIEQQINKREFGHATRFLYSPLTPETVIRQLTGSLDLKHANLMKGGNYHNLKDFITLPQFFSHLHYPPSAPSVYRYAKIEGSLLLEIQERDIIIHTPYYTYDTVLRFFNEAAIRDDVEEIYTTLYRVASDSKIVNALISAAHNGKKVTVFVELKARFDEANNIKWGKRMKSAGVKVIYSIPGLKVHAKIALIKRKHEQYPYLGLLATGNLNENTARFYTDHILLTANPHLLKELETLFEFLSQQKKKQAKHEIAFRHLLVSQFNLQKKFLSLIDAEIENAKKGLPASITIKLNNLEEKVLISRLYEASNAGVKINLIVRSVCCLIPGVKRMSENIMIKRIVDRYLEHGRIFIFHNNGNKLVFLGSSDWMNRNIYRRIEVCFPVYEEELKNTLQEIVDIQLKDNVQAVTLNHNIENIFLSSDGLPVRSQSDIAELLRYKQMRPDQQTMG